MTVANTYPRTINAVDFFLDIAFQCTYFNVVENEPFKGINLFVSKDVQPWQEHNFEDRLVGEMLFAGVTQCQVFTTCPINFTHLRKGTLSFVEIYHDDMNELGPFNRYTYTLPNHVDDQDTN